jgi:hypothetical protein
MQRKAGTVMVASGQIISGYWAALLIGVLLLLLTFVVTSTSGIMHVYRGRRNETAQRPTDGLSDLVPLGMVASLWRCQALITEAVIVRRRLSGEIDAETYQIRMNELARQTILERRPERNA